MPSAQLVAAGARWKIPLYAQDMLWVRHGDRALQADGERGAFDLDADGGPLTLLWGGPEGVPLVNWPKWPPADAAGWRGKVAVYGLVERLHVLDVRGVSLVVAEIEGGPLPPGTRQLPPFDALRTGTAWHEPEELPDERESVYPVIALADSVLADYFHHAMISDVAVNCFAALGPQEGRWHEIVGLPLLAERLTLLAPRYR